MKWYNYRSVVCRMMMVVVVEEWFGGTVSPYSPEIVDTLSGYNL